MVDKILAVLSIAQGDPVAKKHMQSELSQTEQTKAKKQLEMVQHQLTRMREDNDRLSESQCRMDEDMSEFYRRMDKAITRLEVSHRRMDCFRENERRARWRNYVQRKRQQEAEEEQRKQELVRKEIEQRKKGENEYLQTHTARVTGTQSHANQAVLWDGL